MGRARRWLMVGLLALVVVGCAAPQSAGTASSGAPGAGPARSSAPRRVIAAIRGAPISMAQLWTQPATGSVPGLDAIQDLMGAGLVHKNDRSVVLPQLAQEVPSVDNGLWKVFPDGRMETTVRLRPTARWHDGTPLTTDDFLFATTIEQDRDIAGLVRNATYDLIDSITAPDPQTIVVSWNKPFIEADAMFSDDIGMALPRHLLESAYRDDKAAFFSIPYWNDEWVGAGPFKLKEWVQDSRIVMSAFDDYVLGRPKFDEIEVRFIPDPNTLMANLLAGVELTLSRGISIDQAVRLTEQWRDGEMHTGTYGWIAVSPQFVNPSPAVVLDLRFRRAMLEAISREQLLDTLMYGRGYVAHSFVSPDLPEYKAIESSQIKYEYDPATPPNSWTSSAT